MEEFSNPFKGQVVVDPAAPKRTRRFRTRSRRAALLTFLVLFGLAGLAALFAKPVYKGIKEWRASRLMVEAEQEFEKENWAAAMQSSHAAYLLSPANAKNLRMVASIFERVRSPRAIDMLGRVVAAEGKEDDRRKLINLALKYNYLEVAQQHTDALLKSNKEDRENLLLAAQVARASSDFTRELALLRSAREHFPNDDEIAFKTERSLLNLGSEAQQAESLRAIRGMAERQDVIGISALEVFAYRATQADVYDLVAKIRKHPLATMRHLTLAADLELRGAWTTRKEAAAQVTNSANGRALEEIAIAASWLVQEKQFEELLRLVPRDRALASEELALMHIDALFGLKRVDEIRSLLAQPSVLTRPGLKNFYQWQLNQIEPGRTRSDKEARLAMDAAFDFASSLAFMGARFEELGRIDLAQSAFSRLNATGNFQKIASQALFRIAFRTSDTQGALALFEERLRKNPSDPWIQNNVAYFHLLLNRPLDASLRTAEKLVADYPDRIAYRSTLALARLRAGNPAEALDMFPKNEFNWKRALPATRAVYVAVLRANAQEALASEVAASLNGATIFPEERSLLTESISGK